jgi:hypothetical protein
MACLAAAPAPNRKRRLEAEDYVMRLPWQARQYERTCADCGYSWLVPRQFARRRFMTGSGYTSGQHGKAFPRDANFEAGSRAGDRQAAKIKAQEAEDLSACPHCSSENYSQRPARS